AAYFALLASTKATQQRQKIEQDLWERLRQSLPNELLYGFLEEKQGAPRPVLGFVPAATRSDGRTATVRTTPGEVNSGRLSYDAARSPDYKVDCERLEYFVVRQFDHGNIYYPEEADRKSGAHVAKSGSGQWGLGQALCEKPLRFTPLWGLAAIDWTDL